MAEYFFSKVYRHIFKPYSQSDIYRLRACSSVWLEHEAFNLGVAGSNPVRPVLVFKKNEVKGFVPVKFLFEFRINFTWQLNGHLFYIGFL